MNRDRFEVIGHMARDILAISISIVVSESIFSTGGHVDYTDYTFIMNVIKLMEILNYITNLFVTNNRLELQNHFGHFFLFFFTIISNLEEAKKVE